MQLVTIALLARYLYHNIVIDPAQNINHSLNSAKPQTSIGKKATNPLLAKLRNTFNKPQSEAHQQQPSIVTTPSIASTQAQSNKKNDYFSTPEQLDVLDRVIAKVEQGKDVLQQRVQANETTLGQATEIDQATQITQTTPPTQPPTPLSKMKIVEPTIQTTSSFQASPQGIMGQGLVAAADNAAQSTLNPPIPIRSAKEAVEGVDRAQVIEAARGAQAVEVEPTPEISPEVEAYVRKVQDDAQTPQEIVIANNIDAIPDTSHHQKRPVIILPITPEIEKKARFKGPTFSIRWLVEWSKKIMKIFFGKVIYRQEEVQNA